MPDLSRHNPTGRFSGLADIYAKSRPSYPDDAIQHIITRCHLTANSVVADIGAGTGISARQLAVQGPVIIGVEPNDDMRTKAEEESLPFENLSFHKGTAEQTGLSDHAVDAIVCAQAFHWFEPTPSLAEFKRILKPHGWAVLMWNERDEKDAFTKEYGDLLRKLPDTLAVEVPRGKAGNALLESKIFSDQQLHHFSNRQTVNFEGLKGRAFSASYAPRGEEEAARFIKELKVIYDKYAEADSVSLMLETSVYSAHT